MITIHLLSFYRYHYKHISFDLLFSLLHESIVTLRLSIVSQHSNVASKLS